MKAKRTGDIELSSSLLKFSKTIERSLGLIELYEKIKKSEEAYDFLSPGSVELTDLIRSAVVISVSAMDAYFTNRFTESLIPYLKKNGTDKGLVEFLSKAGLDAEQAILMATMERPFRRIRTLTQRYLEKVVTQKFHAIDELFLCLGYKKFSYHVQGVTRVGSLRRTIEILVEKRHEIVHEGDLNSHGNLNSVDVKRVKYQIGCLRKLIIASEIILKKKTGKVRNKNMSLEYDVSR